MRLRVNSTPFAEYVAAAIFGRWLWRARYPGFDPKHPEKTPEPPVTTVYRLGYIYVGMIEAANDLTFSEIYTKLLNGRLGKDIVDNIKLSAVQKVAYIADRIITVATNEPDCPDAKYFTDVCVPLVEPYVDLEAPIEMVG